MAVRSGEWSGCRLAAGRHRALPVPSRRCIRRTQVIGALLASAEAILAATVLPVLLMLVLAEAILAATVLLVLLLGG